MQRTNAGNVLVYLTKTMFSLPQHEQSYFLACISVLDALVIKAIDPLNALFWSSKQSDLWTKRLHVKDTSVLNVMKCGHVLLITSMALETSHKIANKQGLGMWPSISWLSVHSCNNFR